MTLSCQVCGAPDAETHFGGITCRACAAFFRRYFHSKKHVISCTCEQRFQNSHPCRECRIQKCLKAGMVPEKVQHKREKHPEKGQKVKYVMKELSSSASSSTTSPSPPLMLLAPQITSRDTSNISNVVSKWNNIQHKRNLLYGKRLDEITYYDACQSTKTDCEFMWNLISSAIPQLQTISRLDQEALLRNFHPKWSLLAAAIDLYKNREAYVDIKTPEDYINMVVRFYKASLYADVEMEPEEILRVFEPFLRYYGLQLALPIAEKKLDPTEYMALAMICLMDGAHTNISPEISDICHTIRKMIFLELRGYHSNHKNGETRFIDTIDTLLLMEKGEAKFQEELLMLDMYNVHIHEDYRLMIREHNY